jgi:hypothetical protein
MARKHTPGEGDLMCCVVPVMSVIWQFLFYVSVIYLSIIILTVTFLECIVTFIAIFCYIIL